MTEIRITFKSGEVRSLLLGDCDWNIRDGKLIHGFWPFEVRNSLANVKRIEFREG